MRATLRRKRKARSRSLPALSRSSSASKSEEENEEESMSRWWERGQNILTPHRRKASVASEENRLYRHSGGRRRWSVDGEDKEEHYEDRPWKKKNQGGGGGGGGGKGMLEASKRHLPIVPKRSFFGRSESTLLSWNDVHDMEKQSSNSFSRAGVFFDSNTGEDQCGTFTPPNLNMEPGCDNTSRLDESASAQVLSAYLGLPLWLFELNDDEEYSRRRKGKDLMVHPRPLLEELEIDFGLIGKKIIWVLLWASLPRCVRLERNTNKLQCKSPRARMESHPDAILLIDSDFWSAFCSVLLYAMCHYRSSTGHFRVLPWVIGIWFVGSSFLWILCQSLQYEVRFGGTEANKITLSCNLIRAFPLRIPIVYVICDNKTITMSKMVRLNHLKAHEDEWNHGTSGAEQDLSGYYDSSGDSDQNVDGSINDEANDFFVGGTEQDLDNYTAEVSTSALPFHSREAAATVTMEKQLQEEGEIAYPRRRTHSGAGRGILEYESPSSALRSSDLVDSKGSKGDSNTDNKILTSYGVGDGDVSRSFLGKLDDYNSQGLASYKSHDSIVELTSSSYSSFPQTGGSNASAVGRLGQIPNDGMCPAEEHPHLPTLVKCMSITGYCVLPLTLVVLTMATFRPPFFATLALQLLGVLWASRATTVAFFASLQPVLQRFCVAQTTANPAARGRSKKEHLMKHHFNGRDTNYNSRASHGDASMQPAVKGVFGSSSSITFDYSESSRYAYGNWLLICPIVLLHIYFISLYTTGVF